MATKIEVAKTLTYLAALFPRFDLQENTVAAYADILEDVPYPALQAAAKELGSRNSPWFPSAGEIRNTALDLMAPEVDMMTPLEAWGEVRKSFSNGSSHQWSSPLVKRAYDAIGGYVYFRYAQLSSEAADRARFIEAFKVVQNRQRTERRMLPQVRQFTAQHRVLIVDGDMHMPSDAAGMIKGLAGKLTVDDAR